MKDAELIGLLVDIGFNQVEANVYLSLLKESPLTGYKIASTISKSRSNVYQALKSLEQKGAVVQLRASKNKQFRAVPIEEILQQKEREFETKKETIEEAFRDLKQPEDEDMIYNLSTASQVYTKSIEMIKKAETIIFVDVQYSRIPKIQSAIDKAAKQNVKIVVLGHEDYKIANCDVFEYQPFEPSGKKHEHWPIDWFCLAVDAREFLIATFQKDSEEMLYAIWSNNSYITGWVYSDMLYEIAFSHIVGMFERGLSREEIWQGIKDYASQYFYIAPGINELKEKYRKNNSGQGVENK
jgi:sugar-specific transcriptional regulator TrmB